MNEEQIQFANYCGMPVIVEEVFASQREGTLARISFDDGREDTVPYSTLDLVE